MQEGVVAILHHPNLGELLTDVKAHGDIYQPPFDNLKVYVIHTPGSIEYKY